MRQLKHHEKKLLKRVDFLQWKNEDNHREIQVREAMRTVTSCDSTIRTFLEAMLSSLCATAPHVTVTQRPRGVCGSSMAAPIESAFNPLQFPTMRCCLVHRPSCLLHADHAQVPHPGSR